MATDQKYQEGVCPECGLDLSELDPAQVIHHADYHWNPSTPGRNWSQEAWERRQWVMQHGGHKVRSFSERAMD